MRKENESSNFFTGVYTRRPQARVEYIPKTTITQLTASEASQVEITEQTYHELSVGPGGL